MLTLVDDVLTCCKEKVTGGYDKHALNGGRHISMLRHVQHIHSSKRTSRVFRQDSGTSEKISPKRCPVVITLAMNEGCPLRPSFSVLTGTGLVNLWVVLFLFFFFN